MDNNDTSWWTDVTNETSATQVSPTSAPYESFYLRSQFVTGLFCYPIVCFFGLTGNALSIIVLTRKKMASSTNIYLTALAVSDSIKLINDSFYFLVILLLHTDPPAGQRAYGYLYPYAHYFFNMSVCTTSWLTVSVAAERYVLVCHATRARAMCHIGRARITCTIVFLSMSVLTIPLALRYRTIHIYNNITNESIPDVEVTELWKDQGFVTTYTWVQNLIRSIIPLLVLISFNYFIIQALRKTRSNKRKLSARHRITLMLVFVIIVFLFCVTPDAVISTFFGYGYYDANYLVRGIREITDLLLTVNSACNFILYCTFNKVFRRNFIALMCTRCRKPEAFSEASHYRRSSVTVRASILNGSSSKRDTLVNGHDTSNM